MPETTVRFDGSSCLNLRSITGALDLLDAGPRHDPLPRKELLSFLWFVEMCVMSNALYFDGTLPDEDVAAANDQIWKLAERFKVKELSIEPIGFKSEKAILDNAEAAILESSLLLETFRLDAALDQAVKPGEHESFANALKSAADLDDRAKRDLALELVSKRFRGSKCAAAIIAAGPDALDVAAKAYASHPNDSALVTGALINRFRLNYLNQLASARKGAYAPDPGFETLTIEHVQLFKDFLLKRVVKDIRLPVDGANLLVDNMREATPLPPIGLYALMLTRERGHPMAVLTTALEAFKYDLKLQRLIWDVTADGMRLRQPLRSDLDAYSKEVDELFASRYQEASMVAAGIKEVATAGENFRKYLIPAVLSAVAGLIPGIGTGAAAIAFQVLTGTVAGASVAVLGDKLVDAGCNSYISQYKNMQYRFERSAELDQPLSAIATRVEQVFGRPLA